MSIERILAPIAVVEDLTSVAATAILVARMFKGHVQFLYQTNGGETPHDLLNSFGSLNMSQFSQLLDSHRNDLKVRAQEIRSGIDDLIERNGLVYQETPTTSKRPSASWREIVEPIPEFVGHFGGVSDLIVVGRSSDGSQDPAGSAIGAALIASGRPVLMAPAEAPATLDQKMLIGWNRSIQAGRGVASALPLLMQAKVVEIVSIATGAKRGPSARDLADYLAWHGIKPEVREMAPKEHRPVGDILLKEAETSGAELLIIGAYSHSRLREVLWGGVTKHVVSHAKLPVLMAH